MMEFAQKLFLFPSEWLHLAMSNFLPEQPALSHCPL